MIHTMTQDIEITDNPTDDPAAAPTGCCGGTECGTDATTSDTATPGAEGEPDTTKGSASVQSAPDGQAEADGTGRHARVD